MANNDKSSNDDIRNNLPGTNPNQQYKGQEGENHSTATEGTLKTPDELPKNFGTSFKEGEENDIDDIVHNDGDDNDQQGGQATPLNKEQKFTPDDITS